MKNFVPFICAILITSLTSCDILEKEDDPCDKTAYKSSGNLSLTVNTTWIDGETNKPFTGGGLQVRVEYHKIACGFDEYKPGGDITYTGYPNDDGQYYPGTANYSIRNSNDKIIVIISYNYDNEGWMQVDYRELSYSEQDFKAGPYSIGYFETYTVL